MAVAAPTVDKIRNSWQLSSDRQRAERRVKELGSAGYPVISSAGRQPSCVLILVVLLGFFFWFCCCYATELSIAANPPF